MLFKHNEQGRQGGSNMMGAPRRIQDPAAERDSMAEKKIGAHVAEEGIFICLFRMRRLQPGSLIPRWTAGKGYRASRMWHFFDLNSLFR